MSKPTEEYESPLSTLTEEEKKKVEKLKKEISTVPHFNEPNIQAYLTELTYFRLLQGWKWDMTKAVSQLTKTIAWRHEYKPDEITLNDLDFMKECSKERIIYPFGYDKTGHPILCFNFANSTLIKDDDDGKKKFKLIVFVMETIYNYLMPKGRYNCTFLIDANKVGLFWIPTIKKLGSVFSGLGDHYCELLNKAYVVNCGFILRSVYAVAKAFMHPTTKAKFSVEKNSVTVAKEIPSESLIKEYGGGVDEEFDFFLHMKKLIEENKKKE